VRFFVSKRKINAKQAVRDIRLGLSDSEMMEKYELSSRGLQSLFEKLINEGLVDLPDIEDRTPLHSRTVVVDLYRCPACNMPQFETFDVCPQCGVIVTKFKPGDASAKSDRRASGLPSGGQVPTGGPSGQIIGLDDAEADEVLKPIIFDGPLATGEPIEQTASSHSVTETPLPPGYGIKKAGPSFLTGTLQPRAPFMDVRVQRSRGESVAPVTQITGLKWKFKTDGQIFASPAISDGVVVFGSWDGNLYAVELSTGNEMWRFSTEGAIHATAAVAYGTVFFGSLDGFFYAVDLLTGRAEWSFETGAPIYSTPTIVGGMVYFTSYNGTLYALDAASGELHWQYDTYKASRSGPALYNRAVCFGCNDGFLYAVE
jgi:outer membrane protein assembly factor BamB